MLSAKVCTPLPHLLTLRSQGIALHIARTEGGRSQNATGTIHWMGTVCEGGCQGLPERGLTSWPPASPPRTSSSSPSREWGGRPNGTGSLSTRKYQQRYEHPRAAHYLVLPSRFLARTRIPASLCSCPLRPTIPTGCLQRLIGSSRPPPRRRNLSKA